MLLLLVTVSLGHPRVGAGCEHRVWGALGAIWDQLPGWLSMLGRSHYLSASVASSVKWG